MAMLYPSCGAHAREVRGAKQSTLTVRELKRLLTAQVIIVLNLPDGGRLVCDKDAAAKRLNVNKRGTTLARDKFKGQLTSGVLRGPVVLMAETEQLEES